MATEQETTTLLTTPQSADGSLAIRWFRRDDQFTHEIGWAWDQVFTPWLVPQPSTEAGSFAPTIQQLHRQTIEGRDVLLGVGSAGRIHFSLTVTATDGIHLHWAARLAAPGQSVISAYRCSEQVTSLETNDHLEITDTSGRSCIAHLDPIPTISPIAKYPLTLEWHLRVVRVGQALRSG